MDEATNIRLTRLSTSVMTWPHDTCYSALRLPRSQVGSDWGFKMYILVKWRLFCAAYHHAQLSVEAWFLLYRGVRESYTRTAADNATITTNTITTTTYNNNNNDNGKYSITQQSETHAHQYNFPRSSHLCQLRNVALLNTEEYSNLNCFSPVTADRQTFLQWDSNPQSQQASGRRPKP